MNNDTITPIMYGLDLKMNTPYEAYVSNIAVEKHYGNGLQSAFTINPYLLKNGKTTIKIRLLPVKKLAKTLKMIKTCFCNPQM